MKPDCPAAVAVCVVLSLGGLGFAAESADPVVPNPENVCRGVVTLIDEAQLPARASATIAELLVGEGDSVFTGQVLGGLDDRQARADLLVAKGERRVQAVYKQDNIEQRSAVASAKVAGAEHAEAVEINLKTPGTLAPLRVRRLQLAETKAELEIEVAALQQRVHELEHELSDTKVTASEERLRLHRFVSPLDGVVARRAGHVGEWVEAGQPVFHVVRMDRLRLEWLAPIDTVQPHKMPGLPVTAAVDLGQGETIEVEGVVGFVSPIVEPSGDYRVWCEFDNRKPNGRWLVRPGQVAAVRIGSPPSGEQASSSVSRAGSAFHQAAD